MTASRLDAAPAAPDAPADIADTIAGGTISADAIAPSSSGLSFGGFVALMASLMAVNALGVDAMLSALPAIGRALNAASENSQQFVIVVYVGSFGAAQLLWGPLGDRFGRKPVLLVGVGFYAVFSAVCALATSFPLLLAARILQGIAAAAPRVLVSSIVRDCYAGRKMAQVMSLSFIVFLLVPVLAPTIGQGIAALAGSWRAIFLFLSLLGLLIWATAAVKLRETLRPHYRQPLSPARILRACGQMFADRAAVGYTIGGMFVFAGLLLMISTIQQVCAEVFGIGRLFTLVFAAQALMMGVAAFTNARLVLRLGSRMLSHTALLVMIAVALLHTLIAWSGHETLAGFIVLQGLYMFCFGLIGSNFSSMAMERMGGIAGTAASLQGFALSGIGAVIGGLLGQTYDHTVVPIVMGLSGCGLAALAAVLWAERGRLFRAHHLPAA